VTVIVISIKLIHHDYYYSLSSSHVLEVVEPLCGLLVKAATEGRPYKV
jgi:hypothetical protein